MFLPVHRIIPFSNVEGIGNRTSIFVQGCNANCLYCHNSETIPKIYRNVSRYTVDELVDVIKGNMPFIRGITVSGGEPTLYAAFLTQFFQQVHGLGLDCYVDTNGFFDWDTHKELIDETDQFLFDVKATGSALKTLCFSDKYLDSKSLDRHSSAYIQDNRHIDNLVKLLELGKVEEVRHVCVKGYYDGKKLLSRIAECLKPYPDIALKLIRVHARGLPKNRAMGLKGHIPNEQEFADLNAHAAALGMKVKSIV